MRFDVFVFTITPLNLEAKFAPFLRTDAQSFAPSPPLTKQLEPSLDSSGENGLRSSRAASTTTIAVSSLQHPPILCLIVICAFPFHGFYAHSSSKSKCQIDRCWSQYTQAEGEHNLFPTTMSEPDDNGKFSTNSVDQCVGLRTYLSCIRSAKNLSRGCHGNIHYYSVRNMLKSQMKQHNCSVHGPIIDPEQQPHSQPAELPTKCRYQGPHRYRLCGLFGDPHLRTFGGQFQTCRVKGTWPLVNNDYLVVQVTNVPVPVWNGEATATNQVTVIVKRYPECGSNKYYTYQANSHCFPSHFEETNKDHENHDAVRIVTVEPSAHVEIHISYISTIVTIRKNLPYFTIAIHMPESVMNDSLFNSVEPELCSKGCPQAEQIDHRQFLFDRRTEVFSDVSGLDFTSGHLEAESYCSDSGLVDFYFDSCVFDLMTTGNKNFSVSAISALKDASRFGLNIARMVNRSFLLPPDNVYSNTGCDLISGSILAPVWIVLIVIVEQCV